MCGCECVGVMCGMWGMGVWGVITQEYSVHVGEGFTGSYIAARPARWMVVLTSVSSSSSFCTLSSNDSVSPSCGMRSHIVHIQYH